MAKGDRWSDDPDVKVREMRNAETVLGVISERGRRRLQRLLAQKCELCGAEGTCQVHHVRKLADLNRPGQGEKPPWIKRMAARRRKTLVVCQECHEAIHRERPKRHRFKAETTGEPLEIERLTSGSEGGGRKRAQPVARHCCGITGQ